MQVTDLKPGKLVHFLGDAHVYNNHVDALEMQLANQPRAFPTLKINSTTNSIDGFTFEDFELQGYRPHGRIPMQMAV